MTTAQIFNRLFNGGNYSLPWLIQFTHPDLETLSFVNDVSDITYDGITYKASSFKYTEPGKDGSGGSLQISLVDNTLIEFLESSDYQMKIKVTGLLNENSTVTPIHMYTHQFCTATWGTDMTLNLQLNNDDRLSMTFPPFIFDSDNNRGGS